MTVDTVRRIAAGRTDLVIDHLASGGSPSAGDAAGTSLLQWCAYYGDVSALRLLLQQGLSLRALGDDLGLNAAAFHGHWRLCQFLIESGALVNSSLPTTGETPLHAALCSEDRILYDAVVRVLLAAGADPNIATHPGASTGSFMRDCRTRAEMPLHRAAAFGTAETIQLLLNAGAKIAATDMAGDTALTWASWYRRPVAVLRLLSYGDHHIHPQYGGGMRANLVGNPTPDDVP